MKPQKTALILFSALALAFAPAARAQQSAAPDPEKLSEIHAAMEAEIAAHHAAGVVTLVMHNGKIVHLDAAGLSDIASGTPMKTDSVFWIASMTKSVSVAAILTLADEGRLSLDEPASNYLPELKEVKLKDGKAPSRPITLRDLMSHTAGIAFPPRKATDGAQSLKGYTAELIKAPLAFEPGAAYEYGFGITVAGRIAELVSGQPFDVFVRERILDPLGMSDTSFHPDERLRARFAKTHKTAEDGKGLALTYNAFVTPEPAVRRMTEPSGGLFSTAEDMAKFYQMILNGGMADGKRIVSKASINEMTKPHSAGGKPITYGLGWQTAQKGFSEKAGGHGGAFGTHGMIDPERGLVTVYMVQNALVTEGGKARDAFLAKVAR